VSATKTWNNPSENPRPEHDIDGETVDIMDTFSNGLDAPDDDLPQCVCYISVEVTLDDTPSSPDTYEDDGETPDADDDTSTDLSTDDAADEDTLTGESKDETTADLLRALGGEGGGYFREEHRPKERLCSADYLPG
jgi:hypothetical protein